REPLRAAEGAHARARDHRRGARGVRVAPADSRRRASRAGRAHPCRLHRAGCRAGASHLAPRSSRIEADRIATNRDRVSRAARPARACPKFSFLPFDGDSMTRKRIVPSLLAASFATVLAWATPASAQFAKPEDAIKYRQSAFALMGAHMGRLAAMAQG